MTSYTIVQGPVLVGVLFSWISRKSRDFDRDVTFTRVLAVSRKWKSRPELTISVVKGTDCIISFKSNYHTITATTASEWLVLFTLYKQLLYVCVHYWFRIFFCFYDFHIAQSVIFCVMAFRSLFWNGQFYRLICLKNHVLAKALGEMML
jgi:hypothetical protein